MHELSLVRSVLDLALSCSAEHDDRRIVRVTLQVGAYRQVVPGTLQFSFEALTEGTLAEGAELVWTAVPIALECRACKQGFEPDGTFWECPACGSFDVCIVRGDEFILESVELQEN